MKWLDRWLFPRGEFLNFAIIACLSLAISFHLIGRQVWQANWGLIDDHEIFGFLGPGLHLSFGEIWNTLLTKTEVGNLQGRFRPGYYLFKLTETSLWGANVHLWYLARTVGFAVFLSSIWWFLRRFLGGWLSGALTAYIALLPLWADVYSRLGPSEIYGASCVGIMVFAAYFILFSDAPRTRNISAVAITLATIALIGMKETFIPLTAGTAAVLLIAGIRKKLHPIVIVVFGLAILVCIGGIVAIVANQIHSSGSDFYAKPIELWPVLKFASRGFLTAVARTWWLFVIPILFFTALDVIPRKPLRYWIENSSATIGAYGFLVATYAVQSALYRSGFPTNMRYDFPAMLMVPLTYCIFACGVFYRISASFSERAVNYAQFSAASFLFFSFALGPTFLDKTKPLSVAVQANIASTSEYYAELERALGAAQRSPESPIILEAYGPGAYEAVFSLSTYLRTLGAKNPISVRLHREEKSYGPLYDGLQQTLSVLENAGAGTFTPLRDSLAKPSQGCISIGVNGLPDASCSGFRVKTP
jgi:hypothetical protein